MQQQQQQQQSKMYTRGTLQALVGKNINSIFSRVIDRPSPTIYFFGNIAKRDQVGAAPSRVHMMPLDVNGHLPLERPLPDSSAI
jgi:hypothetical protein